MGKKMETLENHAGGLDLMVERDAGNEVRILTGKKENSLKFWLALAEICEGAIHELKPDINDVSIGIEQNYELNEHAKACVTSLKVQGFKVDCWSIKGSGKATEDCDIAIDVWYDPNTSLLKPVLPFKFTIEENPYKNGSHITRLKISV